MITRKYISLIIMFLFVFQSVFCFNVYAQEYSDEIYDDESISTLYCRLPNDETVSSSSVSAEDVPIESYGTATVSSWFSLSPMGSEMTRNIERYDTIYFCYQIKSGLVSGDYTAKMELYNSKGSVFKTKTYKNASQGYISEYIRYTATEKVYAKITFSGVMYGVVTSERQASMPTTNIWTATSWQNSNNNKTSYFYRGENDDVYLHFNVDHSSHINYTFTLTLYSPSGKKIGTATGSNCTSGYYIINMKNSALGRYRAVVTVKGDIVNKTFTKYFYYKSKSYYYTVPVGSGVGYWNLGSANDTAATATLTGDSEVTVSTPIIKVDNNDVSISCDTSGTTIYYKVVKSGSEIDSDELDISKFEKYTDAFKITEDSVIYAVAVYDTYYYSDVEKVSAKYTSTVKKGDINGDGKVTATDAMIIAQLVSGKRKNSSWFSISDINGDGKVTATDAMMIAQYVSGRRTSL